MHHSPFPYPTMPRLPSTLPGTVDDGLMQIEQQHFRILALLQRHPFKLA